jgi:hypothetical protein
MAPCDVLLRTSMKEKSENKPDYQMKVNKTSVIIVR